MDFPTILNSPWLLGITVLLAIVIAGWLIRKLHQIFFRWFQLLFSRNACTDETIDRRLSRFAWSWAVLVPICFFATFLWVKTIQSQREICGIILESWVSVVYLAVNLIFLIFTLRLLSFFTQCYQTQQNNTQRPIRPIIRFLSTTLVICGIILIGAVVTKERPLIFLSTLGGAMALFVFVFQHLISSFVVHFHLNGDRMLKVGDWIAIRGKGVDGIVVSISTIMIKVRNWDMSVISFPVRMLLDEAFVNYQVMIESGARRIERSLLIDQRSIRFLTADEVDELKKIRLVTDEMLKKTDSFPETDDLTGEHRWTNIELFTLYAEDYLHRRPDIRHDIWCFVRAQRPTSQGLELELYCFSTRTPLAEFAPVQRAVLYHLLAVLPSFRLRVFQRCSDIHQEIDDVPDKIGSSLHGKGSDA